MTMNDANRMALAVAFYLSKFDRESIVALGYKNFREAFNGVGAILGVNPNTVKNMRDEFDPMHSNGRAGWYQRPLSEKPSRVRVAEMLNDLSFEALTGFVKDLLQNTEYRNSEEVTEILVNLKATESQRASGVFVPRGATGRKAEELFQELWQQGQIPLQGELVDRRDDGCGYDFLIKAPDGDCYIEVKGLAGHDGGILLTDKEWQTAQTHPCYKIFIAYNLNSDAKWMLINAPFQSLQPQRQVRTVVQVSWQITAKQLHL